LGKGKLLAFPLFDLEQGMLHLGHFKRDHQSKDIDEIINYQKNLE